MDEGVRNRPDSEDFAISLSGSSNGLEYPRKIFGMVGTHHAADILRLASDADVHYDTGHPALIGRHGPYAVTETAAVRWLEHMDAALEETENIDADSKQRLRSFFR